MDMPDALDPVAVEARYQTLLDSEQRSFSLSEVYPTANHVDIGSAMAMLSLLSIVPLPGLGTVLSVVLSLMSLGLWRGRYEYTMHPRIASCTLRKKQAVFLARLITYYCQAVAKVEKLRAANWWYVGDYPKLVAFQLALIASFVAIPVPFGNIIPGMAGALLGAAVSFNNAVLHAISWILTIIASVYVYLAVLGMYKLALATLGL
jgi:hypothetical protein